ncbi:hypothetical protein BKA62DRAFT_772077 [Auriculariales sp. MPI-PUGE-AT-0066]|nr:hypothetical protein BKA62DRAFT_772077 [Auriculariales sp. MPI-PUGE-AT-0066]
MPATDLYPTYLAQTARSILVKPPIKVTVNSFIRRAQSVALDHNISWVKIKCLPELKSSNLGVTTGEQETVIPINAISKKVQELSGKWPLIHWGSFGPGSAPGGDFKKSKILPDYRASVVLNNANTTGTTPWQELVSTGEYESVGSSDNGQSQMLHYLLEHLRYRPELREGFAILRLKSGSLRFASANACSIFVTTDCTARTFADALIAYVVLVYDALHRRNSTIELIHRPTPIVSTVPLQSSRSSRYNRRNHLTPTISTAPPAPTNPRYSLQPPASISGTSSTYTLTRRSLVTGRAAEPLEGPFRRSDANKDSRRSERFFYKAAHAGDDKLPGLARMEHAWMDDTPYSSVPDNPYNSEESRRQRCLEVTVLSCVGKDITFCKDVRQSLVVMHDTIDVSRRLALKHLMHRDFSAGNVLCDPVYKDGKQPTSPTCAEAVTDTENPSPQCLVIDLDHAKLVHGGSEDPANFEVTGTPFLDKEKIPSVRKLLPHYPPILSDRFEQMFPDYKTFDDLQTALQGVLDETAKLFEHEDYSIFWVFSIFFASALPKDLAKVPQEKFDKFMIAMHENDIREKRVQSVPDIKKVLHPQLEALAPLLSKISSLLFHIPWCRLPVGPATLAHDLVRCMLLTFIYDDERNSKILGTELAVGVARELRPPAPIFRSKTGTTLKRARDAGDQPLPPKKKVKRARDAGDQPLPPKKKVKRARDAGDQPLPPKEKVKRAKRKPKRG